MNRVTGIGGIFFTGYDAFLKRHEVIFASIVKGSMAQQDIVALNFGDVKPGVPVPEPK